MRQNYAENRIRAAWDEARPEHLHAFKDFLEHKRNTGKGLRENSLSNYATWLSRWSRFYRRPLDEAQVADVRAFHTSLREAGASATSRSQAGILVGAFYKHRLGKDARPSPFWEALRGPTPNAPPDQVPITEKEFARLLQGTPKLRDRMILCVLRESGLRASELCALNVGSVQLEEDAPGAWLSLPGNGDRLKTGPREVYIVHAREILEAYVCRHPRRNDPNAPLLTVSQGRGRGDRLYHSHVGTLVRRAARSAGVTRNKRGRILPISPHLLRITRATETANQGWNEELMRKHFGWAKGSSMPSHYTRISRDDLRARILDDASPPDRDPEPAAPTPPRGPPPPDAPGAANVLSMLAASQAAIVKLLERDAQGAPGVAP